MSQNKFQSQAGEGVQGSHRNESSWLTDLSILGTAATGSTGPTASELITGYIGLTGQQNPVNNVMHILVRLVKEGEPDKTPPIGSTATLCVWVQPKGRSEFYYFDFLNVDVRAKVFTLKNLPPGSYRLGLSQCTSGAEVEIRSAVSE